MPVPTPVRWVTCSYHPVVWTSATCSYCRDEEPAQGVSCLQLEHPTWVKRMVWIFWCPPRISQRWWFLFLTESHRFLNQWPQNNSKIVDRCCQASVLLLLHDLSHNQNGSTVIAVWDTYLTSKKPQRSKWYQTPPDNFLNQSSFVFIRQFLMLILFCSGFLSSNNTHLPNYRDTSFSPSPVPYTCQPLQGVQLKVCRDDLSYGDDLFMSELHIGFALPGKENDGHPECE